MKIINNANDLIPQPSESGIVAKLSRHYSDDIRTAMIIRNIKAYDNLIELLDAFDQVRPSNFNAGNNGTSNLHNHTSFPNVYGQAYFSNGNNFRERNYPTHSNQNNFGATLSRAKQNVNCNRGFGFSGNLYRNSPNSFAGNITRFDRHAFNPLGHLGANQAHDNNGCDVTNRNYNPRQSGNGFVQNHRCENLNTPNTGAIESRRPLGSETGAQRGNSGNAPDAIRQVRTTVKAPSTMHRRNNENLNILCDSEPGISNLANNVDTLNNQGN